MKHVPTIAFVIVLSLGTLRADKPCEKPSACKSCVPFLACPDDYVPKPCPSVPRVTCGNCDDYRCKPFPLYRRVLCGPCDDYQVKLAPSPGCLPTLSLFKCVPLCKTATLVPVHVPNVGNGESAIARSPMQGFAAPLAVQPADTELTKKQKVRHNFAAEILRGRLEDRRRGRVDLSAVLEAVQYLTEAKLDLHGDAEARVAILRAALQAMTQLERSLEVESASDAARQADLERARLARLTAEVDVLKAMRMAASVKE